MQGDYQVHARRNAATSLFNLVKGYPPIAEFRRCLGGLMFCETVPVGATGRDGFVPTIAVIDSDRVLENGLKHDKEPNILDEGVDLVTSPSTEDPPRWPR